MLRALNISKHDGQELTAGRRPRAATVDVSHILNAPASPQHRPISPPKSPPNFALPRSSFDEDAGRYLRHKARKLGKNPRLKVAPGGGNADEFSPQLSSSAPTYSHFQAHRIGGQTSTVDSDGGDEEMLHGGEGADGMDESGDELAPLDDLDGEDGDLEGLECQFHLEISEDQAEDAGRAAGSGSSGVQRERLERDSFVSSGRDRSGTHMHGMPLHPTAQGSSYVAGSSFNQRAAAFLAPPHGVSGDADGAGAGDGLSGSPGTRGGLFAGSPLLSHCLEQIRRQSGSFAVGGGVVDRESFVL